MEEVFKWTGFITLTIVCLGAAYLAIVYAIYFSLAKLKTIDLVFRRMAAFYYTLPKRTTQFDYVVAVFESKSGKFVKYERFKADGENEQEYESRMKEMRQKFSKGGH